MEGRAQYMYNMGSERREERNKREEIFKGIRESFGWLSDDDDHQNPDLSTNCPLKL